MPTQNDEYWFVEEHEPCMLGTIHEPLASVTLLVGPVTAKPLQFVLVTLSWLRRGATRSWGVGSALATEEGHDDDGCCEKPAGKMTRQQGLLLRWIEISCENKTCACEELY